jgi:two-component system, NarL family, nitrate/nitrite response regulator NarL
MSPLNLPRRRISVVIADDHPIVLAGLETLLQREPDIEVVDHCADGIETMRSVTKHRPDILILDLRMPRADGVAVLQQMSKERLPTRVVLLAAVIDDDALLEAIRLGARGVVLKEMAPRFLVDCVREVHAGHQWFEQRAVGDAMDKLVRREAANKEISALLSRREIDVARAVAKGLRNREIAEKLGIAEGTVKLHLHTIYTKLRVDGRTALVVKLNEKSFI